MPPGGSKLTDPKYEKCDKPSCLLTVSQRESYLNGLRCQAGEQRARRDAEAASTATDPRAKLKAQITAWYDSLGSDDRASNYLMEYLGPGFGQHLSSSG